VSPYREQGPGAPSDDPLVVEPGKGVRGIWVGRATAEDVIRVFGDDGDIAQHDGGDVFQISYTGEGRPASFRFEYGLLDEIYVSATSRMSTAAGVRTGTTRDELVRLLGEPDQLIPGDKIDAFRYRALGIELHVHGDSVGGFTIFRARR
jgi:hypothetical protein